MKRRKSYLEIFINESYKKRKINRKIGKGHENYGGFSGGDRLETTT